MEILKTIYQDVMSLEGWLNQVFVSVNKSSNVAFILDEDPENYKQLLSTVYVGVCSEMKTSYFTSSQHSNLKEVVMRAIERILKKKLPVQNVLTLGYSLHSTDAGAQSGGGDVEIVYPNSGTNAFLSKPWEILLSRIGDSVLLYLLENTSLFLEIKQTCFVQLSGVPVNSLYQSKQILLSKSNSVKQAKETNRYSSVKLQKQKSSRVRTHRKRQVKLKNRARKMLTAANLQDKTETVQCAHASKCQIKVKELKNKRKIGNQTKTDLPKKKRYERISNSKYIELKEKAEKFAVYNGYSIPVDLSRRFREEHQVDRRAASEDIHVVDNDISREKMISNEMSGISRKRKLHDLDDTLSDLMDPSGQRVPASKKQRMIYSRPAVFGSLDGKVDGNRGMGLDFQKIEYKKFISEAPEASVGMEIDASETTKTFAEHNIPSWVNKKKSVHTANEFMKDVNNGRCKNVEVGKLNNKHIEEINPVTSVSTLGIDDELIKLQDMAKTQELSPEVTILKDMNSSAKLKRKRKSRKNQEQCWSFKPFDSDLALPRHSYLYRKNAKEKISRYDLLHRLKLDAQSLGSLYENIFVDTKVVDSGESIVFDKPSVHECVTSLEKRIFEKATTGNNISIASSHNSSQSKHSLEGHNNLSTFTSIRISSCYSVRLQHSSFEHHSHLLNYQTIHTQNSCQCCSSTQLMSRTEMQSSYSNKSLVKTSCSCSSFQGITFQQHDRNSESVQSIENIQNECPVQAQGMDIGENLKARMVLPECLHKAKEIELNQGTMNKELMLKRRKTMFLSCLFPSQVKQHRLTRIAHQVKTKSEETKLTNRVECEDKKKYYNGNELTVEGMLTEDRCIIKDMEKSVEEYEKYEQKTRVQDQDMICIQTDMQEDNVKDTSLTLNANHLELKKTLTRQTENNQGKEQEKMSVDTWAHAEAGDVDTRDAIQCGQLAVGGNEISQPGYQPSLNRKNVLEKEVDGNRVPVLVEVLDLLADFIENHKKCPYRSLLNTLCPAITNARRQKNTMAAAVTREVPSVTDLLHRHTPQRQVFLFLRRCLLETVPTRLIGCIVNRNVLMKNLSKLLRAGRYDKVCQGQLMHGIKTKPVTWLEGVSSNSLRLHLLAKLVIWLFNSYIFPLLRTYFYVTDTGFLKYKLLYYRQMIWTKIHYLGISGLLQNKILRLISEDQVVQQVLMNDSLGVSALRFLPKEKSLRPIINMGYVEKQCSIESLSINKQLFVIHGILSFLKDRNPSLLGYGKFGTDDINHGWRQYIEEWQEFGSPHLYFVKTDITSCYNSIIQMKMYNILENILQKELLDDEVVVRKFVISKVSRNTVKTRFVKQVKTLSCFDGDFVTFAKHHAEEKNLQQAIFVDKVVYQHETSGSLLDRLRKHLFHNIVKAGSQYYHQQLGISQGSIISTLLCGFYYAEMEKQMFEIGRKDFLMRIVDDYIFVTPSLDTAKGFLHQMLSGFPAYNCHTNVEKVLTNFPCQNFPSTSSVWFPWCGLMFNTETLEVTVDYSRLVGVNIQDTVTYEISSHPGAALQKKILSSATQKCHQIYLDGAINSVDQIVRNIYLLCLLTAFKMHSYVRKLPQRASTNLQYFLGVIRSVGYLVNWHFIKAQSRGDLSQCLKICKDSIMWICLHAFLSKLGKLPSQYSALLKQIRHRLRMLRRKLGDQQVQKLKTAVEEDDVFDISLMF